MWAIVSIDLLCNSDTLYNIGHIWNKTLKITKMVLLFIMVNSAKIFQDKEPSHL